MSFLGMAWVYEDMVSTLEGNNPPLAYFCLDLTIEGIQGVTASS